MTGLRLIPFHDHHPARPLNRPARVRTDRQEIHVTAVSLTKHAASTPPAPPARSRFVAITGEREPTTLDTRARIRPEWQRTAATTWATTRQFLGRNLYRARVQTFYLPAYLALLVWRSPVGLARLVAGLARYLYDYDSAAVRHQHAGRVETAEYVKAQAVRKANLKARWLVASTIALVVVVPVLAWTAPEVLAVLVAVALFVWIVKLIPGRSPWELPVAAGVAGATWWWLPTLLAAVPRPPAWPFLVAIPLVVLALGWHGRVRGKAIVKATDVAAGGHVEPIRAPMVTAALCTLGDSKMREPAEIKLLMDVARTGRGYQIDLELPAGVTAGTVMEKRAELASALRRELGCVWPAVGHRNPAHLSLFVSDETMSSGAQAPWPLAKAGGVNLFQPVRLFTDQRGAWVEQTIAYTSWVVGAVPRMGKTYFVRQFGLVAGLDVRSKVLAFDLKGTGDLSPLALFAHAYGVGDEDDEIDEQLAHMRWVHAEMRRRTKIVRGLTLEQNPEKGKITDAMATADPARFGPIVVLVDECQVWFEEHRRDAVREEFVAICRDLVKRGPALGIICMFATQKPDAKSIPTAIADNASARLCLKVNGWKSNDQVLGTSSHSEGIRATQFAFADKGVAWFRGDGAEALIVRTVHGLDARMAERIAARARALREGAGLLTGDAAGEMAAHETAQVVLVDDVRHVLQGAGAMHLATVVEGLALLRDATYGTWNVDTLGSALRSAGVRTGQVKVGARNTTGVRAEWLEVSTTAALGPGAELAEVVPIR